MREWIHINSKNRKLIIKKGFRVLAIQHTEEKQKWKLTIKRRWPEDLLRDLTAWACDGVAICLKNCGGREWLKGNEATVRKRELLGNGIGIGLILVSWGESYFSICMQCNASFNFLDFSGYIGAFYLFIYLFIYFYNDLGAFSKLFLVIL
jgi:hypothetical protein